jgi:hypothetical protein
MGRHHLAFSSLSWLVEQLGKTFFTGPLFTNRDTRNILKDFTPFYFLLRTAAKTGSYEQILQAYQTVVQSSSLTIPKLNMGDARHIAIDSFYAAKIVLWDFHAFLFCYSNVL